MSILCVSQLPPWFGRLIGDKIYKLTFIKYKYEAKRAKFLDKIIPKNGVCAEIGVCKGDFTYFILAITKPAKLHLIDPWYLLGNEWWWAKGDRSTINALIKIINNYRTLLLNGTLILSIGYDLEILPTFPDKYFDWIYLDTTHAYEQTKKELSILKYKVKEEGIIAGDDWQTDPAHPHHGVCKAIREFIEAEPYFLLYSSDDDKQWAIQRKFK